MYEPTQTVDEQIADDWDYYSRVWGVAPYGSLNCNYEFDPSGDGPSTGNFGVISWHGDCGGGNEIVGTPYPYAPGKNTGNPCDCAGDPINLGTGNEFRDEEDASLGALGFHRYYNSHAAVASSHVGAHWRHSFDRTLQYLGGKTVSTATVFRQDGTEVAFTLQGGQWITDTDVADRLTSQSDGTGAITGWQYFDAATRYQEAYDASGNLQSITDTNGQVTTLTYSTASTPTTIAPSAGLLLTVTDPHSRSLSFTYNAQGNVASVTEPDGGVLGYAYDANSNLVTATYPDTKTRQYVYNESALTGGTSLLHALTGDIDESGNRLTSIGYNSQGQATMSTLPGGVELTQVVYNSDSTTSVTYPTGAQTTLSFTAPTGAVHANAVSTPCGTGCGQPNAAATFDNNGYVASTTDFKGNITALTHDANGLLTEEIDAQGNPDQRTIDTTWNTVLRVPLTRTVKDNTGKVVSKSGWAYNTTGQPTAACLIDPVAAPSYTCSATGTAPAGVRRSVMTYCTTVDGTTCPLTGLLLNIDGPRTDVTDTTTYAYYPTTDESGCAAAGGVCHHLGDVNSTTDGAGLVTTYVTYDKAGRPTRVKAPNGVLTDLTYTPRGWLTTKTVRASAAGTPSANDAITTIAYNPDGTVHQIKDGDGVTATYTYDAAHRLTDITDAGNRRYHYVLDAAGNRTLEQVITEAGTVVRTTGQSFNALGQLTTITDGLGRTVFAANAADSYDANGNLVHSTDGLGIQQKHVFDGLDRLVSTLRDYQGTNTATANSQSVTTFDALDRVTGFSDPDGLNTTYDIDALGNVTGLHSPDTGTTARSFDINGNRTGSTDATNVSQSSTFDADNRLLTTTYADTTLNVQYKYDEADSVTGCTGNLGKGHLTRVIEGNGGIVWCYDNRGNVLKKQQTIGTDTRTTTYVWTLANRLKSVTTPNGTVVAYARNSLGQITSVTAAPSGGTATTVVSGVVYKSFGPVASYKLGDGQTVTLTYDATGALTDIASTAFSLHVKRDAMGNIVALGNTAGVAAPTETYGYDPLYRLTGVTAGTGSTVEAYTYNKTGDRLTKTAPGLLTGTYNYATGTHHLMGVGTTTRQVDARGNATANVLASGTYGYGYNGRNRLTVVQNNGVTVGSYVLNALGQRVQKTAGSIATRFDYDEDNRLLSESAGSTRDYVWMDSLPVGIVDRAGPTTTVNFIHADGLGSPRVVTSSTGTAVWQWPYASNPFGENAPTSSTGYTLNLRFPGQYFDTESGASYNVNRDYEAATGRYIQSDPIGLRGGPSTYLYVDGKPQDGIDPLGLQEAFFPISSLLSDDEIVPRPLLEPVKPMPPGAPVPQLPEDFPKIPSDPAKCPGKGWEWRGPDAPGGPRGAWYNPEKDWTLHPDMNHPEPIGPHWDWIDEDGNKFRITPQAPPIDPLHPPIA